MKSLKTFISIYFKGFLMRSLLVVSTLLTFSACDDGSLDDYYARPTCNMTDAEKETQKALDVDSISDYFYNNNIDTSEMQKTVSGIHYFKLSEETGDLLKKGDKVQIHYIGKFLNGNTFESSTTFDNSYNGNRPLNVIIGITQPTDGVLPVIEGWYEALQLMKVGEETRFYIPSYLAYGKCGRGSIPPNAVISFDIKVVKKF